MMIVVPIRKIAPAGSGAGMIGMGTMVLDMSVLSPVMVADLVSERQC
jgi:hypothetical protein